ncbi:MAG: DUF2905 domain-containing protein [bacterium]
MDGIGKLLISLGLGISGLGLFLLLLSKIPGIGRLPGDIYVSKGHFTFYFPWVTCLVASIILSLIGNIFFKK